MTDLSGFLLARIAEDEELASAAVGLRYAISTRWSDAEVRAHVERWSSARVLSECEAKRQIVAGEHGHFVPNPEIEQPWAVSDNGVDWIEYRMTYGGDTYRVPVEQFYQRFMVPGPASRTLRLLALPYADHPDYRQEWRP